MRKFYRCECFVSNNIFLPTVGLHVKYRNEKQFWEEYGQILKDRGMKDRHALLSAVQAEVKRRLNLDKQIARNVAIVKETYIPLHPEIFQYSRQWFDDKFLELADFACHDSSDKYEIRCKYLDTIGEDIYTIRALKPEFCEMLVEELDNFNDKIVDRTRPNTMNTYGVVVEELGMLEFVNEMISDLLSPISKMLFPEWYGDGIDSHKSFTLKYALGEDTELAYHYDNAEITFNFCLGKSFSGAEVYFTHMAFEKDNMEDTEMDHVPGVVCIHRARHMHGTQPLLSGSRYNLLTWLRSSSVRNTWCPMCKSPPQLSETTFMGDGFTAPT